MTWVARPARKLVDGPALDRLICGRTDVRTGRYVCQEPVAMIETLKGGERVVVMRSELTAEGTPGQWRVNSDAMRRKMRGDPVRPRHGLRLSGVTGWPDLFPRQESGLVLPSPGRTARRIGVGHYATLPCTAPCKAGHENRIDEDVVAP